MPGAEVLRALVQRGAPNSAVASVLVQRMSESDLETLNGDFGPARVREALESLDKSAEDAQAAEVRAACEADPFGSAKDAARPPETKFEWTSSGDPDWGKYLRDEVAEPATMNCWEYLLFVAVRTGQLSKAEVVRLYTDEDGFVRAKMNNAAEIFAVGPADLLGGNTLSIGDAIVFDIAERHVALSLGGSRVADLGGRYEEVTEPQFGELVTHQNTRMTVGGLFGHLSLLMDRMEKHHNYLYDFREYLTETLGLKEDQRLPSPFVDYLDEFALKRRWPADVVQAVRPVVLRVSSPPVYRIPKAVWIGRVKSHVPPERD
ncbi:hypothetical protein AB0J55_33690 [Amycolatopsis sp. NPDC049688]|uniref:hypothetical protein n=1 Tax=Amycolatopsis sp. NPDC049688 TaxID=3154733 RepID=UPI0034244BB1